MGTLPRAHAQHRERLRRHVATVDGWLAVHMEAGRHESVRFGAPASAPAHMLAFLSETEPVVWWLFYDELGRFLQAHADAALPARLRGREIDFVDLDMDVIVAADLSCSVRDEEEFEAHRVSMHYPEHVVRAAREGIQLATAAVEARAWPLDGSAELLLGRLMAAALTRHRRYCADDERCTCHRSG